MQEVCEWQKNLNAVMSWIVILSNITQGAKYPGGGRRRITETVHDLGSTNSFSMSWSDNLGPTSKRYLPEEQ